ncbi:hypothetical protein GCM10011585_32000 [Edaphobacter dinghuensis]|uniref:Uncharacterized protein n=1 Tax=Edaphobacter dinghuensis TaxID=1560005 RepID=A0A917HPZ7_9BACT|nr:hypothetical protein GCM10011585_32000 [Edaphobacter dinghuensis]
MRQNIRQSGYCSFAVKYCRITGVRVESFVVSVAINRNGQNTAPLRSPLPSLEVADGVKPCSKLAVEPAHSILLLDTAPNPSGRIAAFGSPKGQKR